MSTTIAPPLLRNWVDSLNPAQIERLRAVAETDDVLPSIESTYDPLNNPAVEHWLRTTVRDTCERHAAGLEPTYSGDEVRAWLEARRPKAA